VYLVAEASEILILADIFFCHKLFINKPGCESVNNPTQKRKIYLKKVLKGILLCSFAILEKGNIVYEE
jgi:hypothetical protein